MVQEQYLDSEEAHYLLKIVLLGDPAVGKTSLVKRYIDNNGWAETVWRFVGKVPIAVVGTKADLKSIRETSMERSLDFARLTGAKVFETSAKTGEGVEKTFKYITQAILSDLQ